MESREASYLPLFPCVCVVVAAGVPGSCSLSPSTGPPTREPCGRFEGVQHMWTTGSVCVLEVCRSHNHQCRLYVFLKAFGGSNLMRNLF